MTTGSILIYASIILALSSIRISVDKLVDELKKISYYEKKQIELLEFLRDDAICKRM